MDENKIIRTDANDNRTLEEADKAGDVITLSDGRVIICTRDKKNRRTVPDEIMGADYKQLPDNTTDTRGRIARNGGILNPLNSLSPEEAAEIRRQGAEALNAKHAQRQSIADTIDAMLRSKAGIEEIQKYNLPDNATKQEALVAAMYAEAINKGTVRAFDSLRDTVGEKPVERQQIEADIMTEADKRLIENLRKRLQETQDIVIDPEAGQQAE